MAKAPKKIEEGDREEGEENPREEDVLTGISQVAVGEDKDDDEEADESIREVDEESEPEKEEDLIDLVVGGHKVRVSQEVADAWEMERRSLRTSQQTSQRTEEREEPESYTDLLFTDPDRAIARLKAEIKNEVEADYRQDQSQKDFWSSFYGENPQLKEDDTIVRTMMGKHWDTIKDLPVEEAKSRLATYTKKEIMRLTKKYSGGKAKNNQTDSLEGESSRSEESPRRPKPAPEPKRPMTLGEAIKQRNLMRRSKQSTELA